MPKRFTIEYVKEWASKKENLELVSDVYINTSLKLQWRCGICNRIFPSSFNCIQLSKYNGCPRCGKVQANKTRFKEFGESFYDKNINSYKLRYFKDIEDSKNFSPNSDKKVIFKCLDCGFEKPMVIGSFNKRGFNCDRCSDNIPLSEKIMTNILLELGLDFRNRITFDWSNKKQYDFYIPSSGIIIETHGAQHYKETNRGRSLKEEQENDLLKYNLAIENGIKSENYIAIDCRYTELKWIQDNCIKSLSNHFNIESIDFEKIFKKSLRSTVALVCDEYNNGLKIFEIYNKLKLGESTVARYLKIGNELGMCNYKPKIQERLIYDMYKDGVFIKRFFKSTDVGEFIGEKSIIRKLSKYKNKESFNHSGYTWVRVKECDLIDIGE